MGRPRSDIAPRVVRAARARFLADGVDGASLREIAADAGTSIGMIYYYFATKDDLFLAVVEEVYAKLLSDLGALLEGGTSFAEQIRRVSLRIAGASDEEVEVLRLVVREALVSSTRLGRILDRSRRGHFPLLFGAVHGGMERGEIDAALPPSVAVMMTAAVAVLPQVIRRVAGPSGALPGLPDPEALAQMVADRLLHGIAPPAHPEPLSARPARPPGKALARRTRRG